MRLDTSISTPIVVTDPYMVTDICVERLYDEYTKHGRPILALDYDDTIYDYHQKGRAYPEVVDLVKRAQAAGFYICLFTGSPPDKYPAARAYAESLGIKIDSINTNPFPLPFGNHGKMYFNILLDDRAGLSQACATLRAVLERIEKNT